jgi:hypothetical protein
MALAAQGFEDSSRHVNRSISVREPNLHPTFMRKEALRKEALRKEALCKEEAWVDLD